MKIINHSIPACNLYIHCIFAFLLLASCRKENAPSPSMLDENYFVIKDGSNNAVDYAIYEFYKSTGIASFYNDTIHKKQVSEANGIPLYEYKKLSLDYHPFGNSDNYFKIISNKANIPSFLKMLEEELLPILPSDLRIPSILLVDSFWNNIFKMVNIQVEAGMTALQGFNTIGMKVMDVEVMSTEEKKMYVASLLAGIAEFQINRLFAPQLQVDFFNVSRTAAKNIITGDVYNPAPIMYLFEPNAEPTPASLGFLRYSRMELLPFAPFNDLECFPLETEDLRAFLCAVFYYMPAQFTDLNSNDALVVQKFSLIRDLVSKAGFKIPE